MTSNDLVTPDTSTKSIVKRTSNKRNKTILKGRSMQLNVEITDKCLDETLRNNNLYMDLAMQIIFNDQTVRSNTVQDLKDFNSQSLATQAKKENN